MFFCNNLVCVVIVMGFKSDWVIMQFVVEIFEILNVLYYVEVVFVYCIFDKLFSFVESVEENGYQVIIVGVGGAVYLLGMIVVKMLVLVLGVLVQSVVLSGVDSFYFIV